MIVLVQQGLDQMVFDNVTHIKEILKPSAFGDGPRAVINICRGETVLMGGDDIDSMTTKVTILPNAERE